MDSALSLSDAELLARVRVLVDHERAGTADVIEHLIEIDRRRLYLEEACSSLTAYCRERLSYSEDEAQKRVRVARFAASCPAVLAELRAGAIHLTGLFLISQHVPKSGLAELLSEARGKSRREIERVIAARFPRPDVAATIETSSGTGSGAGNGNEPAVGRLEALSATTYRVEFTASAGLYAKLERVCSSRPRFGESAHVYGARLGATQPFMSLSRAKNCATGARDRWCVRRLCGRSLRENSLCHRATSAR